MGARWSSTYMGLALSGGGFRATLFHLGALLRLNEQGVLPFLQRISGVSGGAIVAAYLGMQWRHLNFIKDVAVNFEEQVVKPLRKFCSKNIDTRCMLIALLSPWNLRRAGNVLEVIYRRNLLGDARLQDLPDSPEFTILSTNLLSGTQFRFSKDHAGDDIIGAIPKPTFKLSQAVAASSAFPPFLSPFQLHVMPHQCFEPMGFASGLKWRIGDKLYLSDAGLIDNLA